MVLIFIKIWLVKLTFPSYWKVPTSLVYAQAVHETGLFTSPIFKEGNNLFGMKTPSQRNNHIGSIGDFAKFPSHWVSIKDYFQRQEVFGVKGGSVEEYTTRTLDSNYAGGSSTYLGKWLNHFKSDDTRKTVWKVRTLAISGISIPLGMLYAKKKGLINLSVEKRKNRYAKRKRK
jgi:hypothetical protein